MPKHSLHDIDLNTFGVQLSAETDRACGVLGAALLDAKLEALLRHCLSAFQDELLGNAKPLGSFSARISIARALALISEDAAADFDTIRRIRNDFAHSFDHGLDFTNQSIADRCANLRCACAFLKGFDEAAARPARNLSSDVIRVMQGAITSPRKRYELAVDFLAQYVDDLPAVKFEYAGPDIVGEVHALSANTRIRVSGSVTVSVPVKPSTTTDNDASVG
jgi:hypothetical protein